MIVFVDCLSDWSILIEVTMKTSETGVIIGTLSTPNNTSGTRKQLRKNVVSSNSGDCYWVFLPRLTESLALITILSADTARDMVQARRRGVRATSQEWILAMLPSPSGGMTMISERVPGVDEVPKFAGTMSERLKGSDKQWGRQVIAFNINS